MSTTASRSNAAPSAWLPVLCALQMPCPDTNVAPPNARSTGSIGVIMPYCPLLFTAKSRPTAAQPSSATTMLPESPGSAKGAPPSPSTVHVSANQTVAENLPDLYGKIHGVGTIASITPVVSPVVRPNFLTRSDLRDGRVDAHHLHKRRISASQFDYFLMATHFRWCSPCRRAAGAPKATSRCGNTLP